MVLLQKSRDRLLSSHSGEDQDVEETVELQEEEGEDKRFPSVTVETSIEDVPQRPASNFEEARLIFLPGQRAVNASKAYFTLEDHCTDFVEAARDLSAMLKVLAAFEQDLDRRFKMHKRRVAALEEPLNALSRQHYLLVRIARY